MESNVMVGLCIKNVSFFPKVMCHIVHHNEQNKTKQAKIYMSIKLK